ESGCARLFRGEQQEAQQYGCPQLGVEISGSCDHDHEAIEYRAALALNDRHQPFIEFHQVGPTDEQSDQDGCAEASSKRSNPAHLMQTAMHYAADKQEQSGGNEARFAPEALR